VDGNLSIGTQQSRAPLRRQLYDRYDRIGELDHEAGEIVGTWTPAQLAPGPGGGTFRARKLAPGEELDRLLQE
jgi:hypothetical protein